MYSLTYDVLALWLALFYKIVTQLAILPINWHANQILDNVLVIISELNPMDFIHFRHINFRIVHAIPYYYGNFNAFPT